MITVSESSHSDLYWGMRGAGHNFGIVTRFDYKLYDVPCPDWYFATLIFTNDKLESLFHALNAFSANGTQPKAATTYTLYTLNPEISATEVSLSNQRLLATISKLISHVQTASDRLHLRIWWCSRRRSTHASPILRATAHCCNK